MYMHVGTASDSMQMAQPCKQSEFCLGRAAHTIWVGHQLMVAARLCQMCTFPAFAWLQVQDFVARHDGRNACVEWKSDKYSRKIEVF